MSFDDQARRVMWSIPIVDLKVTVYHGGLLSVPDSVLIFLSVFLLGGLAVIPWV